MIRVLYDRDREVLGFEENGRITMCPESNVGKPCVAYDEVTASKRVVGTVAWDGAVRHEDSHSKGILFALNTPTWEIPGGPSMRVVARFPIVPLDEEEMERLWLSSEAESVG